MLDWRGWDPHKQRIVSAVFIVVPLFAIIAAGPYWSWLALVCLAAAVGLWEFQGLLLPETLKAKGLAAFLAAGLILPCGAAFGGGAGLHGALAAVVLAGFASLLVLSPSGSQVFDRLGRLVLGWLYIPYLLSYVLLISRFGDARAWIFFILIVTAAGDTGAFYIGRRFGRHKLFERVSPKKTIEGSIGGLFSSVILGTLFGVAFIDGVPVGDWIALCAALAVTGQVGDLIESAVKRMCGRKDSSNLLPGHGGVLDRLDSLLFVFPGTWLFLMWMR